MIKKVLCASLLTAALALAVVPRPVTDMLIPSITGTKINLRSYKGKAVAVAIISTMCKECAETAQMLGRVQKDLGPRGFQSVVVIGDNDSRLSAPPFAQRFRLTMPVGYLTKDDIIKLANITTEKPIAPIILFIDKQGIVQVEYFGDNQFFKSSEAQTRGIAEKMLQGK